MAETVSDGRQRLVMLVLGAVLALALIWLWITSQNLSVIDQRNRDLEARFAAVAPVAAIATLEQKQAELETRLASPADALAALDKRVGELDARLAAIPPVDLGPVRAEVAQLRSTQESQSALLAPAAGLDELRQRVDRLDSILADDAASDLAAATEALRADVGALKSQFGSFAPADVAALGKRLDELRVQVEAIKLPDLAPQEAKLKGLIARLDRIETATADTSAMAELQTKLDALASQLATVSVPDIAPLEGRLEVAVSDIDALKSSLASAASTSEVDNLKLGLAQLGSQLADPQQGLPSARAETSALAAEVDELRTALAERADSGVVTALSDKLAALDQQVATLPASDALAFKVEVEALRTDLSTLKSEVVALPLAGELAALRGEVKTIIDNPPAPRPPQVLERIYFGPSSAAVPEDEMAKLALVVQSVSANPGTISLVGFSDSQGPAELNRSLSLRRAASVRLALLQAGLDPALVTSVTGLGEDAPPVTTSDEAEEAGNRVVLIYGHR